MLKALAARWSDVSPDDHPAANPDAGATDLNAPGLVGKSGVPFMEGEQEPAELQQMKRGIEAAASDMEQTASWLTAAMDQSWNVAGALAAYPARTAQVAPQRLGREVHCVGSTPDYVFSASELIDRASDLMAEPAILVHDNERRWRVFAGRVRELLGD